MENTALQALEKLVTAIDKYYQLNKKTYDIANLPDNDEWTEAYHHAKKVIADSKPKDSLG